MVGLPAGHGIYPGCAQAAQGEQVQVFNKGSMIGGVNDWDLSRPVLLGSPADDDLYSYKSVCVSDPTVSMMALLIAFMYLLIFPPISTLVFCNLIFVDGEALCSFDEDY